MNLSSEEIALHVKWDEVRTKFVEAKANREAKPEEYAKAKAAMSEMRSHWRQIRTYLSETQDQQVPDGDAIVSPGPIRTASEVSK
jgi:hypothetical protein